MSEHREFYLGKNYWFSAKDMDYLVNECNGKREDHTHVIELSAYLAEKARADKAERKLAKALEQRNEYIEAHMMNTKGNPKAYTAEYCVDAAKEMATILDAELDAELGEG